MMMKPKRSVFLATIGVLLAISHSHAVDDAVVTDNFLDACTNGNLEEIKKALREHPDWLNGRSANGETCLHVAGIKGQSEVSQLILKKGGDVNIRSTFDGGLRMHPLSWNVYGGHLQNVRVLLEEGKANVNLDYDSNGSPVTVLDTVLGIVPEEKSDDPRDERWYELKDLLLKHGAKQYKDLNLQNDKKEL